ncbi:hypothetical protein D1AOALGA4SA_1312 [Olavius algarvensis Delta 1 endosymbiont]|nr:hypothetical protein D1AOALGA4SA_1312 [Olavius algarvensis Delta 1 endosymbiont]
MSISAIFAKQHKRAKHTEIHLLIGFGDIFIYKIADVGTSQNRVP